MILAFSQQLNNKPTLFVEKIINSLHYDLKLGSEINKYLDFKKYGYDYAFKLVEAIQKTKAKKHTIRKDKKNLWKAGRSIHFTINRRTPNQFQFAPVIKCVSTQKIEIIWHDEDDLKLAKPAIFIDDKWITEEEEIQLAKNDGFNSTEAFFEYFNTDFIGKIIHWTNLKY